MRCCLSIVLALAWFVAPVFASAEENLRESLLAISTQSTVLEISDILLHRNGRHHIESTINPPEPDSSAYITWLGKIEILKDNKTSLLKLLKDPDAKIRTLAMTALAARDDITVLPAIAALVDDPSPTYAGMHKWNAGVPEREREKSDQMVCDVAQHIIGFYLDQAHDTGGDVAEVTRKTEDYVVKVREHPHCAISFLLSITRSIDLNPASKAYSDAKAQIRSSLDETPLPDRAWIALWLDQKCPYYNLYSREELIAMFRDVGPDAIMSFLQGKTKGGTDPDARDADTIFFLEFADRLLRPSDANMLSTLGNTIVTYPGTDLPGKVTEEKAWPDAHLLIAAAKLQPKKAAAILRTAFDQFANVPDPKGPVLTFSIGTPSCFSQGDIKAELCTTLWEMCGESQAPFIADRFYDTSYGYREDPNHDDLNGGWRSDFLNQMAKVQEPPSQKMVVHLLEDKRAETYRFRFPILSALCSYTSLITGRCDVINGDQWNFYEFAEVNSPQLQSTTRKALQKIHDELSAK